MSWLRLFRTAWRRFKFGSSLSELDMVPGWVERSGNSPTVDGYWGNLERKGDGKS